MQIIQIKCPGRLKNLSYLLVDQTSKNCAVIDPSCSEHIVSKVNDLDVRLTYIINTHLHHDHVIGNQAIKNRFQEVKLVQHTNSKQADIPAVDEAEFFLGEGKFCIFHTPGHTQEDICILAGNNLFTGDTLFVGKVGGTKSKEQTEQQYDSLKKLMSLPETTVIWPGHNNGKSLVSTIGKEKHTNPFCLRLSDFKEFNWLKQNWKDYKAKHWLT